MRYRIILQTKVEANLLRDIKSKHSSDVEGISELYDQLVINGSCDSLKPSSIYYVAYTLALNAIEIMIVKLDKL